MFWSSNAQTARRLMEDLGMIGIIESEISPHAFTDLGVEFGHSATDFPVARFGETVLAMIPPIRKNDAADP